MNREVSAEILKDILDSIDKAAYAFDRDRKIIYINKEATRGMNSPEPGSGIGAAEVNHFEENIYLDEAGNVLPYPKGSALEMAFEGKETENLIIEHRNKRLHTQRWLCISCKPVLHPDGSFAYGILSYQDVSKSKNSEHKLKFLVESAKILSVTMDFEERLQKKAALAVPSLADWCAIDILLNDGTVNSVALVHRDPKKIQYLKEFQKKYPEKPGASSAERVMASGKAEFVPLVTDEQINALPGITPEHAADIKKLELTSVIAVPIGIPGNMLGVFTVAYAESGRTYTKDDLDFFTEFGNHLTVILENAKLYYEIKQRDTVKDEFLATLSHELRNPLAPIKSALELIRLKGPKPEILEDVAIIEHQFDHMTRLLSDLLDASRFIQGKIKLDRSTFNLVPLLTGLIQSVWPLAEKAGLSIVVSIEVHEVLLEADPTRIEQALSNLLHNAIKFTPSGGSIFITLEPTAEKAILCIRDTGAGITEEEIAHIFKPYYQSNRVQAGNRGLGIGLRLVHDIIEIHQGSIAVTSEGRGKGSQFTVTLPTKQ
jgi:signal transduction histidine kinase